jgi:hypothetical protein
LLKADGQDYNYLMKDFRQLKVWEKGHQLALAVYKATKSFPIKVEVLKQMPASPLKTLRADR